MQERQDVIEKIANYLNVRFNQSRRQYSNPNGQTRYISRKIEEPAAPNYRVTETEAE